MEADNPWTILSQNYAEGDVVDVKVVSLTPFGAFAEVIPGIDGLIHISQISNKKIAKPADELSQISNKKIAKPADELSVGDVVKAKITAIDYDAKKVSLSIRALLEQDDQYGADEAAVETDEASASDAE